MLSILLSVLAWIPILFIKGIFYIAGFIIVPVCFRFGLPLPRLYRGTPGRPDTVWELMIRNPVDGFKRVIDHPPENEVIQKGEIIEADATDKRFQWRWRRWKWMSSIRLLWRYNRTKYGEFYLGWKLNSMPPDLDFAVQLRVWADVGN